MKERNDIDFKIRKSTVKINCLRRMVSFSNYPYQKQYYNQLLLQEMKKLDQLVDTLNKIYTRDVGSTNQREFTIEELANYDGANGKLAYVAVNGVVYDVSSEATWGGGTHFGLYAGKDVTDEFSRCHFNQDILKNLPEVGVLK